MAITTKLQTKFALQRIFLIVISLVFGLWGIYDYRVAIPNQERLAKHGRIYLQTKIALEVDPENVESAAGLQDAMMTVHAEMQRLLGPTQTPEQLKSAIQTVMATDDASWFQQVTLFENALREVPRRMAGAAPSKNFQHAYDVAKAGVNETAEISPPGKFDRATQWMFISCLPFVPYFIWGFIRLRRNVYRLDDDGTLHAPEGTWAKDQIADIDMSRWMAKSIASVETKDGGTIKLDDYIYRNIALIVGSIASERYPDEWEEDGRKKTSPEDEASETAPGDPDESGDAGEPEPVATEA